MKAMRLSRWVRRVISRLRESESGNIAVISALSLPVLVGLFGLGTDAGYWYFRQRTMQGAADLVAYNATAKLRNGTNASTIVSQATSDAITNGWQSGIGSITVHTPPTSGTHMNGNSVEIILTENEPRFFSAIYTTSTVPISVRAVANYTSSGVACLLALSKTAQQALQFWGNNLTTMNGCNVMSDSMQQNAIAVGGSSAVTVPCAISVGGVAVSSTLNLTQCGSPVTGAAAAADPYSNLAVPPIPGACTAVSGATLNPGKYCSGMTLQSNITLNPGVYVVDGGTLKINAGANISGSGVTFFLRNGATINFNGNAHMNMSAPTSGTYSGVLFYSDRTQSSQNQTFNGDSTSRLTGALYFPSQKVTLSGNYSGNNGCMQVVADMIELTGSTTLSGTCPNTGIQNVPIPGSIALVE